MSAALHGSHARAKPGAVSWEDVYAMACTHKVEALAWMGLPIEVQLPRELRERWQHAADMTLLMQLSYDEERAQILDEMAAQGLSYIPLKGIHTATYYPQFGMRSMSDNDILYGFIEESDDGEYRPRGGAEHDQVRFADDAAAIVRRIMEGRGYEAVATTSVDTGYYREPFFSFEMHHDLLAPVRRQYEYYRNPWRKAKPTPDVSGEMQYSLEDEYLFHVTHMYKHYADGGCGIRFLADEQVYQAKLDSAGADRKYIMGELGILDLVDFEHSVRSLSEALFGAQCESIYQGVTQLNAENQRMLDFMLTSGAYGTTDHVAMNRLNRVGGVQGGALAFVRYAWRRLCPGKKALLSYHPFLARHPWLTPLAPIYRGIRALTFRLGKTKAEMELLNSLKQGEHSYESDQRDTPDGRGATQ
jgi:hypothetical protein